MNKSISIDNEITQDTILFKDIKKIIEKAREEAVRSVDFERVIMYWKIGERILKEEQRNTHRAEYGKHIIEKLSRTLIKKYGNGFSKRALYHAVRFYKCYPIVHALRTQLNWFQYRMLSSILDSDKREFYELETINNNWTGRELERQIDSQLYERLLLSNDKKSMMEIVKNKRLPEKPTEIIKDPMILEFLGLENRSIYRESDLESALIEHLEKFLLELGRGFTFVARQKRITLEEDEYFIDLVFYNRLLKAHVIMEIKTRKVTHEDLGQLQMYVNYYDRKEKLENESATIGVLLCTAKNDELVKYALPKDNQTILASKYQLILPSEKIFLAQIATVEEDIKKELNTKSDDLI